MQDREIDIKEFKIKMLKEVIGHSYEKIDKYYQEIERHHARIEDNKKEISILEEI